MLQSFNKHIAFIPVLRPCIFLAFLRAELHYFAFTACHYFGDIKYLILCRIGTQIFLVEYFSVLPKLAASNSTGGIF